MKFIIYFKIFIVAFILILFCEYGFAKDNNNIWLPKKYLEALINKEIDSVKMLEAQIPIEAIVFRNKKLEFATTYGGDFFEYSYKIIKRNPLMLKIKDRLLFCQYVINSFDIAQKYLSAEIIFCFDNDKLTVFSNSSFKKDTIEFTKYLYGKRKIQAQYFDLLSLRLSGNYSLYNDSGKKIEDLVTITPDSLINNSKLFKSYDIYLPYIIVDNRKKSCYYSLIELITVNNERKRLIAEISNDYQISFYKYYEEKSDYKITDLVYILKLKRN